MGDVSDNKLLIEPVVEDETQLLLHFDLVVVIVIAREYVAHQGNQHVQQVDVHQGSGQAVQTLEPRVCRSAVGSVLRGNLR